MSIRTTVYESLPYTDREPTAAEREAAQSLISDMIPSASSSELHSSLPPLQEPSFSPLIRAELERAAAKQPLAAIDLSRYQELDAPARTANLSELQNALWKAYTQNAYLMKRHEHLSLLDNFGKNAWLVGNWQTEAELQALERELAATKKEIDVVNIGRRRMQEETGGELKGLEETWRKGVGRVLETEIAVEELKRKVREKRRAGAS